MDAKEFIEKSVGYNFLVKASRQQRDLRALLISETQGQVYTENVSDWCESVSANDAMLNWVQAIFKIDNYQSFVKYLRFPLVSSFLANTDIEPQLKRLFFSDDAYNSYMVSNDITEEPPYLHSSDFSKQIFKKYLYSGNDVIYHELRDGIPKRRFVSVDLVVAIQPKNEEEIQRIAIKTIHNEKETIIYIDEEKYIDYDVESKEFSDPVEHGLGFCPVSWVSPKSFNNDYIVRDSKYSRMRSLFEDYVFYSTLQKMVDPNGAIPIAVMFDSKEKDGAVNPDEKDDTPMSSWKVIGHKKKPKNGLLQSGTIIKVPIQKDSEGKIDTSLAKNYLNFYRSPVDSLNYLKERIKEIERKIVTAAVGDYFEPNSVAKNELDTSKSYISKQDKLRNDSESISYALQMSNKIMISLANQGKEVKVINDLGTDFFIETKQQLLDQFEKAPNIIERTRIIVRIAKNSANGHEDRLIKEELYYSLLPYVSDKDFKTALDLDIVTEVNKYLQLNFQKVIFEFESLYGDIVEFYKNQTDDKKARVEEIRNLLLNQIKIKNEIESKSNSDQAL